MTTPRDLPGGERPSRLQRGAAPDPTFLPRHLEPRELPGPFAQRGERVDRATLRPAEANAAAMPAAPRPARAAGDADPDQEC